MKIKYYLKVLFSLFGLFLFFKIENNPYKIIRLMRTNNTLLVSEYSDGVLKKQIPKRQTSAFLLSIAEEREIDKEFFKLNLDSVANDLNKIEDDEYPTVMFLFIKENDTVRTNFFSKSKMPNYLKKLDYLLAKNRTK